MTRGEALKVLRGFQAWRRYQGGPETDGPDHPGGREVGEALDVAIEVLGSLESKPKPEKEYYGG